MPAAFTRAAVAPAHHPLHCFVSCRWAACPHMPAAATGSHSNGRRPTCPPLLLQEQGADGGCQCAAGHPARQPLPPVPPGPPLAHGASCGRGSEDCCCCCGCGAPAGRSLAGMLPAATTCNPPPSPPPPACDLQGVEGVDTGIWQVRCSGSPVPGGWLGGQDACVALVQGRRGIHINQSSAQGSPPPLSLDYRPPCCRTGRRAGSTRSATVAP